jgi:hypothetical protein
MSQQLSLAAARLLQRDQNLSRASTTGVCFSRKQQSGGF